VVRAPVMNESGLPAPLHTAPAFLRFPFLEVIDKVSIARALAALIPMPLRDNGQSFQTWLQNHGQTEKSIERFWKPILVSALNEDIDRVSISSAGQVVRESLRSPSARHMGVPQIPLTELYDAARAYIETHGGEVKFRTSAESFRAELSHVQLGVGGREEAFDYVVLALPFDGLAGILPNTSASQPLRDSLARFETSPITGIHLWFDREISELEHAVLLDRTIQWMFHKSKLQKRENNGHGSYVELVVSSSKSLVDRSKQEIVDLAVEELREFFPAAREANLVKSTVIKEIHATYSPKPGIDLNRPRTETVWPRVFLAGDWTATGWPATMEGAVRSGYLAAQSIARVAGKRDTTFLVPDLAPTGFMRLFG
jgi:squalene-associated FAD-dependent desaturase